MSGFRNRNMTNHALRPDAGQVAANVILNDEMRENVRATESLGLNLKTRKDLNNRLQKMISWMQKKLISRDIIADERQLIRILTPQERADSVNYHKCTHDFIYENLPSSLVKSFLSDPEQKFKRRKTGDVTVKQYGFDQIRKYHDAILYGANRAGKRLPIGYGQDMKKYLDALKKSKVQAKKTGELDENEADPINLPLYHFVCEWSIITGDVFFWVFTVLLWNCLSRCINIDDLQFHNIKMGTDSAIIEFDSTKMDSKGERTTPKNVYANPFDYKVCLFTAFGCYFCLVDEEWYDSSKVYIFINKGSKIGTAAGRYCSKMKEFVNVMEGRIKEYIRPDHLNPYGLRKGSDTHATSGTTVPPPLTSVFLCSGA